MGGEPTILWPEWPAGKSDCGTKALRSGIVGLSCARVPTLLAYSASVTSYCRISAAQFVGVLGLHFPRVGPDDYMAGTAGWEENERHGGVAAWNCGV